MKYYDKDQLLIGSVGYAKAISDARLQFIKRETVIVKQDSYSDYKYFDVCSNRKYKDFQSMYCDAGDLCINNMESLNISVRNFYEVYKDELENNEKYQPIKKILTPFLTKKKISKNDISNLVLFINELDKKTSNSYQIAEEKIPKALKGSHNQIIKDDYYTILTNKDFKYEPTIGRDDDLKNLIISLAQDKKNPIIVGESGVGKTALVDELAYKIKTNEVPNFLKNKKIIEVNLSSLLSGIKYVGTLESKVTKMVEYAIKNDAIVFIDEIHTIYGAGTHDKSDYDVSAMIKQAIDRQGLKVIGTTTTDEYNKYFKDDALKRRFEKIQIEEPNQLILYKIIDKVFIDYSNKNNIELLNKINDVIVLLIELTSSKHRTYNDKVNNPDLVISIIDKIFADAKVNNQDKLTIENIIYGINSCMRINNSIKNIYIERINSIEEKTKAKILKLT